MYTASGHVSHPILELLAALLAPCRVPGVVDGSLLSCAVLLMLFTHVTCVLQHTGIVANNASGMCCGVAHNTFNTLHHMRILFADGTLLDTADKDSCDAFQKVGAGVPSATFVACAACFRCLHSFLPGWKQLWPTFYLGATLVVEECMVWEFNVWQGLDQLTNSTCGCPPPQLLQPFLALALPESRAAVWCCEPAGSGGAGRRGPQCTHQAQVQDQKHGELLHSHQTVLQAAVQTEPVAGWQQRRNAVGWIPIYVLCLRPTRPRSHTAGLLHVWLPAPRNCPSSWLHRHFPPLMSPHRWCVVAHVLCPQVGYSLNALVDFPASDPISIIKHLMVGSEGTLGFVSNVTYKCVPQAPHSVRSCLTSSAEAQT